MPYIVIKRRFFFIHYTKVPTLFHALKDSVANTGTTVAMAANDIASKYAHIRFESSRKAGASIASQAERNTKPVHAPMAVR